MTGSSVMGQKKTKATALGPCLVALTAKPWDNSNPFGIWKALHCFLLLELSFCLPQIMVILGLYSLKGIYFILTHRDNIEQVTKNRQRLCNSDSLGR